ncbi:MAG: methyltransferase domain-containing protein [Rhodobacteraceae bacterium]|nr:MAG: methyltransferase domain-containing protein [Paracoccaceae bacterium]
MSDNLTRDGFLGGRLHLWQPARGYRAGVDPVLLAAAVPARSGQSVLDLGCGVGAAALCLAARVPDLRLTGVERQADYADLARRNAEAAGARMEVHVADLADLPRALRAQSFDHVIANPPYFDAAARKPAPDAGREAARAGETPLSVWLDCASRRLAPSGYLHVIQRAQRLPDLLCGLPPSLGSLEVLPLAARDGRAPDLVILRARKGGRGAFRLHAALILHEGARHLRDAESYRPWAGSVLRDGAALPWPDRRH